MKSSGLPDAVSTTMAVAQHLGLRIRAEAAGLERDARRQADEAVAAEAFAADDGLEQEAVAAAILHGGELEVERERGLEIGKGFRGQRDAVVALLGQVLEFEFR